MALLKIAFSPLAPLCCRPASKPSAQQSGGAGRCKEPCSTTHTQHTGLILLGKNERRMSPCCPSHQSRSHFNSWLRDPAWLEQCGCTQNKPTNRRGRCQCCCTVLQTFPFLPGPSMPLTLITLPLNNPRCAPQSTASATSLLAASTEAPHAQGRGVSPQQISLPADNELQQPYQSYRNETS